LRKERQVLIDQDVHIGGQLVRFFVWFDGKRKMYSKSLTSMQACAAMGSLNLTVMIPSDSNCKPGGVAGHASQFTIRLFLSGWLEWGIGVFLKNTTRAEVYRFWRLWR
jgi:hypothetical protein